MAPLSIELLSFQIYSIRTRGRAVDILNTCANIISSMNDLHKGVAKQLLFPILPQFTEAFVQALQVPDGETSDRGLKMEILKVRIKSQLWHVDMFIYIV